jgi:hypothetical protein
MRAGLGPDQESAEEGNRERGQEGDELQPALKVCFPQMLQNVPQPAILLGFGTARTLLAKSRSRPAARQDGSI